MGRQGPGDEGEDLGAAALGRGRTGEDGGLRVGGLRHGGAEAVDRVAGVLGGLLVDLGKDEGEGQLVRAHPVDELEVHLLRLVAGVDQHEGAAQRRALAEIIAHGGVEELALGLGDMRIAVARQVDEAPGAVDREEIDQLRLARQVGDLREVLLLRQQVDQGRLADVGAADEGEFRQHGMRARGEVGRADGKGGGLDFQAISRDAFPPTSEPCFWPGGPGGGFGRDSSPRSPQGVRGGSTAEFGRG